MAFYDLPATLKTFHYNDSPVSFDLTGETLFVNATQMAKPFKRRAKDYLILKRTKELIDAISANLSEGRNPPSQNVVKIVHGIAGGTWMHKDLALDFARWLAPAFALWCGHPLAYGLGHQSLLELKGQSPSPGAQRIMAGKKGCWTLESQ